MVSEALVLPATIGWGGPYSDAQTALGGQVFTGFNTPNSREPDALCRQGEWWDPQPEVQAGFREQLLPLTPAGKPANYVAAPPIPRGTSGTPDYMDPPQHHKQQHIAARSKHPGGVNASRCDGSCDFFSDDIELRVWDEMCSAVSGKPINR
jgi:hypothetical protein